ncbi:oligomeric golgi complex component, COG2-domain-containing protein [Rhodofomes roseus]|uniref:Conserved oligomeric Golgi complex subunit 2 n=1 Tax=Rhodofomes roseus TaxID=34475 RepID=A0ABQ8KLL7_9APHY|nr:oligomeric golgi complex component, COG2-domain-containing protein [Rhodofomes roseus]KAH9839219.1 oligomeric golgi complex component, COG2-domain-containing protein [Rhodofomes roseus]
MSSLKSPEVDAASEDPFDLQRLAEELVTREQRSTPHAQDAGEEITKAERDLPVYVPLSHSNPCLSAKDFSVEEFLLSRSYTSLPDLRSELRDYLATLKEELVKLINDDYEAFISLSTDLRGEGARLERLKAPLSDIKSHVLEARQVLQVVQEDVQLKLSKRSTLREEKAFLHLLLKISESITRLESLLLIASPTDTDSAGTDRVKAPSRYDDNPEDRTRANRAKHLSRVAAEYTQLLYHAAKARTDSSAFVDESQWRIDRIKSTLSSDLDHLFASTLTSLTSGSKEGRESKTGELDKAKWIADVTECLRTYDVLGLWRDAEDVLRREIVRDFVKKSIHPGALASPHSPILPHTPLPPKNSAAPQPSGAVPRTPYTPFTAFASKQNPFEFSTQQAGAQAHILDDREGPLAGLYNAVLRFVDRDLRRLMEIAERVCVKSGSRAGAAKTNGSAESGDEQGGFEIMANVVWAEIGRAVLDELGGVVFAAGKPDDFRKHHETTQAFIRSLEFLAPSVHAIEVMRTHPVYVQFERRWQLPVYFQLRWKEIVSKLEEALTVTRLERSRNRAVKPFVTTQAAAVWDAISTCWGAPVYIPELNHRFWKFTLQLLSRYKTWLQSSLPVFEATAKVAAAVAAEKLGSTPGSPASLSRAATPNLPTEAASPEAAAADEQSLHQFSTAVIDIRAMKSQVLKIWRGELCIMLPEVDSGESDPSPEDALRQALSGLTSLIPSLSGQIITILSRRACEALLSMRSIPSQFRAMSSSRRTPTEPSYFVSLIFKPVKTFFAVEGPEGAGGPLKDEFMQAYVEEIFEIVAQRYIHFLSAMRKTEESLRRLKKGKKSAFSLFGGSTAKDDDGRADEEKIRAQMMLDVAAFGLDAESLGVAVQHSETFKVLEEMAGASFTDASQMSISET